jgi:poly(3-hydroxybutyrate) depolymerase
MPRETNMHFQILWLILFLTLGAGCTAKKDKIVKEGITFEGRSRTYYLFVPENLDSSKPAPLLVALHGAGAAGWWGRLNGSELVNNWKTLAKKMGIVVVGPSSTGMWTDEKADFLRFLIESIKARFNIDSRRVYLTGFSNGGCAALATVLKQPGYFTAVAVYSGIILPRQITSFRLNDRRTPIAIWAGDNDDRVSMKQVNYSVDFLKKYGFPVQITIVPRAGHLGMESEEINAAVWSFLESSIRNDDPQWIDYRISTR